MLQITNFRSQEPQERHPCRHRTKNTCNRALYILPPSIAIYRLLHQQQTIVYFLFCSLLGTSTSTTPFQLCYFRLKPILGCGCVCCAIWDAFGGVCRRVPSGLARFTILTHLIIRHGLRVEPCRTPVHRECPKPEVA